MRFTGTSSIFKYVDWTAFESSQPRPARNLAWEDCLLEGRDPGICIFLVYRNEKSVVIGRNQNPWKEALTGAGFPVYRRRSGGGAVYHDTGNLNWSFMVPRDEWGVADALEFVASAVRRLGVELSRDPRGALFLDGGKVCGTARRYFGPSVLIHGTLLVSADLDALRSSLDGLCVAGDRSVASVPSPVRNLADAAPSLTVDAVRDALFAELADRYGPPGPSDPAATLPGETWKAREREHASWDWVFGNTLPFLVVLGNEGAGPCLRIREGRAEGIWSGEDRGGEGRDSRSGTLPRSLAGRPFDAKLLREVRDWYGIHEQGRARSRTGGDGIDRDDRPGPAMKGPTSTLDGEVR